MALEKVTDIWDLQKIEPKSILTWKEHNVTGSENTDLFLE
jgi:hypothetical protein